MKGIQVKRQKLILGCLVAALAVSMSLAPQASAHIKWWVCEKDLSGKFSNAECSGAGSGWESEALSAGAVRKFRVQETTFPPTLKTTVLGLTFSVECKQVRIKGGSITNESVAGKEGTVGRAKGVVEFYEGCKASDTTCTVAEPLIFPSTGEMEMTLVEFEGTKTYLDMIPNASKQFGVVKLSGASCPVKEVKIMSSITKVGKWGEENEGEGGILGEITVPEVFKTSHVISPSCESGGTRQVPREEARNWWNKSIKVDEVEAEILPAGLVETACVETVVRMGVEEALSNFVAWKTI